MVPLLSQLFLGILGDFQENRVKHALWIAKIKILLYAILTVFLVLSPFSLVSVIMIVIINLISDTLSYLSAYMMNALYISVIKDDLHDAMGFRQSLMRVVRIVANLAGAFLINVISIQTISLINTLTFVIAFLGLYVIRHTLYEVEKRIEMSHTALSFKKYFQHLKQSLAVLLRLKDTVILLFLTTSMIAILDVSPRLIALRFIQQTLAQLSIGQLLALLSIIMSCGAILGNMISSNLFKNIRFMHLLVFCEISLLALITSILCQAYIVIFMTSFISSTIIGILSPRLQAAVFAHIPSDKMGTVGSALSTVDILAPSLLSIIMSCGAILGNMTSSNLFKNIRFTHLLVFCEISLLTLITSILCQAYIVIFMTSFISSTIIGILSPRLQAAVFAHIPSDKMGTVGSALSTVDILAPSLLSLLALSIASGVSVQLALIFLYLILIALIFCQWLVKFNTHN
ncbi:major facilitator superfamily permease [Streptococcus pneumoniae]|nr:major facilitator superfamily permease [Streptococcus pneumoniae]